MIYLFFWIASIVLNYFIARCTLKLSPKMFGNEPIPLIAYIIAGLIFFPLNTFIYLIILMYSWVSSRKMSVTDFALKIFGVKDGKKP